MADEPYTPQGCVSIPVGISVWDVSGEQVQAGMGSRPLGQVRGAVAPPDPQLSGVGEW
jgi:hypothetical protein